MNIIEIAKMMDGVEYPASDKASVFKLAKENGIVIVFGLSDDLIEFRGAIDDEMGAYERITVKLNNNGIIENDCENDECPHFKKMTESAPFFIKLESEPKNENGESIAMWKTTSNIPHASFNMFEDDELYGNGIVFYTDSLS